MCTQSAQGSGYGLDRAADPDPRAIPVEKLSVKCGDAVP